jgi:hypothetical protein
MILETLILSIIAGTFIGTIGFFGIYAIYLGIIAILSFNRLPMPVFRYKALKLLTPGCSWVIVQYAGTKQVLEVKNDVIITHDGKPFVISKNSLPQ